MRLLIALLLIFSAAGCDRQKAPDPQAGAPDGSAAPAAGEVDRSKAGRAAPDLAFLDPEGESASLADFRGKPLLLNLWATWCAPCVAEMPTLDALAARENGVRLLAVSQDMAGQEAKVAAFFEERELDHLQPYLDPELALMTGLGASVLPTTILYDAEGREVWRVVGALDWTGPEAARLIDEAR